MSASEWQPAEPARDDHPYLLAKSVGTHGIRQRADELVIPMRDASGELYSLQFISPAGTKRYLAGGRVRGCYFSIGKPNGVICVAEGFATAASVHETSGHAVAVAFNAGNLEPVARAIRAKLPNIRIVVCADDDYRTPGNPGLAKGTEAARAVGGVMAIPDFGDNRPDSATDFNDLARHRGAEAAKRAIANAKAPDVSTHRGNAPSAMAADSARGRLKVLTIAELLTMEIPEREAILSPWLLTQSLNMTHAYRGVGKTHIALGVAYAVATGGTFLTWKADRPRSVLYLDGEMPAAAIRDRLARLCMPTSATLILRSCASLRPTCRMVRCLTLRRPKGNS